MTEPLPTDDLLNLNTLRIWAQETTLSDPELADLVIDAVSRLLRLYGSAQWTAATIPGRARDIGYIVAKDYYLNPRQLRQETTGPIQESLDASVLRGINLTEEQKLELATLAGGGSSVQPDGLFMLETTRGPVETRERRRGGNVILYDTRETWPIEYLNSEDSVVFLPENAPPLP